LGERRASAIKEFLVASGIQADRIKTVSYGKERPAVVGSNESAYSQNRRAVGILQ
jgi:peptidoglycan-associated lipoprotein